MAARQSKSRAERALVEMARRAAQGNLLAFMRWCWWEPTPLQVGLHTRAIANRLTRAVADWREGKSTYLLVAVPFRHGKSLLVSNALPAWFLGVNADRQPSVIMSGYGADLVADFSRKTKRIIEGESYRHLFPTVEIGKGEGRVDRWAINGSAGQVTAVGLGGALTGRGGHLIICDDYCRNRAEAVSALYRNTTWDAFRNNLMTRQSSPASVVVVCATPWHVDDVRGRILAEMKADSNFPQFEELTFPARRPGEYDYLFPELHRPEWYDAQRAMLGKQAAALLDCAPVTEGGARFATDRIKYYDSMESWPQSREHRGWDLASSSKERDKDDPDWTWGVRGFVVRTHIGQGVYAHDLYISSMVATRAEATERNALIYETAKQDGAGVWQHIEAFGAYKDAYTQLRDVLQGAVVVKASRLPGDKSAKAAPMEPLFDGGRVHIYKPGCDRYLGQWLADFNAFPAGKHDDAVDATAVMFHAARGGNGSKFII
jgi:predicted phage terminase large subunit-like protein